ncbi:MAG: hypothetical protein AAF675_09920 [Pseudomonadota bacterium]
MRQILFGALAVAVVLAAIPDAEAKNKRTGRGGDNAVSQASAGVRFEWQRARAVGGYGNPFTALVDALTGRERPERPGQVQPVVTPQEALDLRNGSIIELF